MTSRPNIPSAGAWDASPAFGGEDRRASSPNVPAGDPIDGPSTSGAGIGSRADVISPDDSPFGGESFGGQPQTLRPVSAPVAYLYASMLAVLVSLVLTALAGSLLLSAAAWLLSVTLGLGLAMVFVVRDTARQASPWYDHQPFPALLYRVSIVVALVGIVAACARIALFVGRM